MIVSQVSLEKCESIKCPTYLKYKLQNFSQYEQPSLFWSAGSGSIEKSHNSTLGWATSKGIGIFLSLQMLWSRAHTFISLHTFNGGFTQTSLFRTRMQCLSCPIPCSTTLHVCLWALKENTNDNGSQYVLMYYNPRENLLLTIANLNVGLVEFCLSICLTITFHIWYIYIDFIN